jgi:hypothetical protein
MKLFLALLFSVSLFGKVVETVGEGSDLDRDVSRQKAISSAKSIASTYFQSSVQTTFQKDVRLQNGEISQKNIHTTSYQTSESNLELVEILREKTSSQFVDGWGTIYKTKVKAKFKLSEKTEKKKEVSKPKPKKRETQKPKKVTPKQTKFIVKNRLKAFRQLSSFVLLIPEKEFHKFRKLDFQFEKHGKTYKSIKKYLHKTSGNFSKELLKQNHKLGILISDGIFFSFANLDGEPIFKDVKKGSQKVKVVFEDKLFRYY